MLAEQASINERLTYESLMHLIENADANWKRLKKSGLTHLDGRLTLLLETETCQQLLESDQWDLDQDSLENLAKVSILTFDAFLGREYVEQHLLHEQFAPAFLSAAIETYLSTSDWLDDDKNISTVRFLATYLANYAYDQSTLLTEEGCNYPAELIEQLAHAALAALTVEPSMIEEIKIEMLSTLAFVEYFHCSPSLQ